MSTTRSGLLARAVTTLAAGAALVVAPGLPGSLAAVPPGSDPAAAGAHFVEQQLVAGGHLLSVDFGGTLYPDYGLTADAVLALDAAGAGQDEAARTTDLLEANVVNYTGFGDPSEVYAGSVAKLLNVAVAQGVDPTSFGGTNLVTTLLGLAQPSGRFSDQSAYGDLSNTFGQSFAVIGLTRATGTVPAEAVQYLVLQQCPAGGFQLEMSDAGCAADTGADPDATAMALQALALVGGEDAAVTAGLDYLAGIQGTDGGLGGAGPQSGTNANSTALAAQAFSAGGRTAEATAAVSYLAALQYGCDAGSDLRGGVAYDQAAYDGAGTTATDADRRATTQALIALSGVTLASVSNEGAAAATEPLTCAAPTTSTPAPTTPSTSPTSGSGSTSTTAPTTPSSSTTTSAAATAGSDADPTASGAAAVGSAAAPVSGPAALAQTGSDLLLPVLAGLALVALGALALWASRRRGAHA